MILTLLQYWLLVFNFTTLLSFELAQVLQHSLIATDFSVEEFHNFPINAGGITVNWDLELKCLGEDRKIVNYEGLLSKKIGYS